MTNPSELKNILYVDDDPDLQKIVQLSLQAKGEFTVQVCDSGMEAIAKSQRVTTGPDYSRCGHAGNGWAGNTVGIAKNSQRLLMYRLFL